MNKIRISIVEDNAKLRRRLAALLNDTTDLCCHSVFASAEEALLRVPVDAPEIVLMDIRLPGINGIECVARLVERLPKLRIIMLTAFEDSDDIFRSLAAGAHGYLLKSTTPDQLLDAIREVAAGGSPISGSVARKIIGFFHAKPTEPDAVTALAAREREVLKLLADGCPYKEIAGTMNLSLGTVRTYIERIYEKLHVHSRTEAVVKYLSQSAPKPPHR
jgi:DNA-binding NarL/FixJ family response regulator